jgi:hypothetical protein
MNRRNFILGSLSLSSLLMIPPRARAVSPFNPMLANTLAFTAIDMSPLQKLKNFGGSIEIEGDMQDEAHEIFWNKDGYIAKKGGIPAVSESYDVVIVGGGIAGLSAAYYLKDKKVLLIEMHNRLGGNSKSQVYGKSYISQGAAYITIPDDGDEIDTFLKELKIKNKFRSVDHGDEAVTMKGKFVSGFWDGATDPTRATEFKKAHELFRDIYENKYPEIPVWETTSSGRSYFNSLDRISFANWLKQELGDIHPHIMEYITLYCWSSFSASPSDISAAQGLNFLSCDLAGTLVLPGGNGLISEALYTELKKRPHLTILNQSFAVDIKSVNGKAVVCYKDVDQNLKTVSAASCIVAIPKMVAKKIISDLPAPQLKAMTDITYRAYLVANIFLKKKVPSKSYDVFTLQGANPDDEYNDSKDRVFADIVFSDWASKDSGEKSALTLYLPLPYDMAQQYLFIDGLHGKYLDRIKARLIPVLEDMKMGWSDVEGMRLVRYGHSVPVAKTGSVSSGLFERASASIDNCIHFANQDNWGNPCFETSFGCALEVVKKIKKK